MIALPARKVVKYRSVEIRLLARGILKWRSVAGFSRGRFKLIQLGIALAGELAL